MKSIAQPIPLAILALALAILYGRLLAGEAFFWGLPALQFVPWRHYGFEALRAGVFPLWNPYNGAGAPLMANYQSAFLYPPNWLGLLAPTAPLLGWEMSVTAVLHLFIGGLGMWVFTGRSGHSWLGRGVSAIAYALTGYTVARLGTYPTISVAAWLPWLLWGVHRLMAEGGRRNVAMLALFSGLTLTAGHAQTAWYSLLLAGCYALWKVRQPRRDLLRLGLALLAVILGAGLAALQLAATADYTLDSQRADRYGDLDRALLYSYSPLRLPTFLIPNLFGNPGDGSYIPTGLAYEDAAYVGIIPLIAAFAALWVALRCWWRREAAWADAPFWLVILLVGFVLALGKNTPLYPFLYNYVPTFEFFQAPVRWMLWVVTALAVMGGVGTDHWGVGKWPIYWSRLLAAGAIGGGLLAAFAPRYLPADLLAVEGVPVLIRALSVTAIWIGLAALLTLFKAENIPERFLPLSPRWTFSWQIAVLIVVAADLAWAGRGYNPTVPREFYAPLAIASNPLQRGYWPPETLDLVMYGQRISEDGTPEFFDADELGFAPWISGDDYRTAQLGWQTFRRLNLPNMNLLDRTYLLNNLDPLLLQNFSDLLTRLPSEDQAIADGQLADWDDAGVDQLYTLDGVITLPQAGARARVSPSGEVAAIVDGYNQTEVRLTNVTPDESGMARLWLFDLNADGWQVTVNGVTSRMAENIPNARVVNVPTGDSVVHFAYRPVWFVWGALVNGISVLLWLGLWMRGKRVHQSSAKSTTN